MTIFSLIKNYFVLFLYLVTIKKITLAATKAMPGSDIASANVWSAITSPKRI